LKISGTIADGILSLVSENYY